MPNLLVIVIDTLRADHVYGAGARTPNIDALARDGISFTRTFPEAMPTVPARNSLLSGRRGFPFWGWYDRRGLIQMPGWQPLGDVGRTFTSVLRDAGWWTAYVTDNPFLGFARPYEPFRESFDLFHRRGGQLGGRSDGVTARQLRHWVHPSARNAKSLDRVRHYIANADYAHDERKSFAASVFTSGAEALERAAAGGRPWALVVDTFEPHEPWTPPRKYIDLYGDPDYRGPEPAMPTYGRVSNWLTRDEAGPVLARMRALYAAELTMTDRWLGVLLDRLHQLDLERDTVIVLAGDHGFQLGEHGWTGKISAALHRELIRVPLIVIDPQRRRAGATIDYRASLHDVGPTVLRMLGVGAPDTMEGVDLSAFFRGRRPPERRASWGGYSDYHYFRDDRYAFFAENRMRNAHVFDLKHDPGETHDLAPEQPGLARELHERVLEHVGGRLPYYGL
ncbi:MAG TPA: sulfatase [Thermoleophilaceae bacterium]|nr:sulfatase [Thermoleophilaceae bacterium]